MLTKIKDILSIEFLFEGNALEEIEIGMHRDLIKSGCRCLIYNFDKNLSKEYKGGFFPFFKRETPKVCSMCDYTIFAENNHQLYVLLVELKKSNQSTFPQLKAGETFVKFILNTVKRINDINISPQIRYISIKEIKTSKKTTKEKGVVYDDNNHYETTSMKFWVKEFLV